MRKKSIGNLAEQVKTSLISHNNLLWFPHLTNDLANMGWRDLAHNCGLTELNYSTGRLVSGNPEAQCVIIARLAPQTSLLDGDESPINIELLSENITLKYQEGGVHFYTAEEVAGRAVLDCLRDAINILSQVPTLADTVVGLAKALHVIKPENDEYDVSFTEPHIPFSVFVSVPSKRGLNDILRTAEGILHEAMHLQLTLIERIVPLVKPSGKKYYSPWRGECRTAQGVLHALYVFRVIDQFLDSIRSASSPIDICTDYVDKRRNQIAEQVAEVYPFQSCPDLTWEGKDLVRMLVR